MHQNDKTFLPTPSAHLSKIILFLNAGFLAYVLSACGANVPIEEVLVKDPKETKAQKKLYDFTKNSALEGINLEKSPTLKSHKKSDKKFYKQLPKNNIAEGVSMPVVNFNKALSFGPYFERTKSKKTQYMDGGLMMHIRF
ncbi:hypothetical protein [Helicobacter pylori]|uniref:hypothetical protein n=1 Tax=Helicobacter pylori TaxID=210 RepID=UPI001FD0CEA9|nr:hypothetical protein [Helicobacter pylori]UOS09464.1 hypothetical protein MPG73_03855 [Helicobacter pylori]